LTANLYDNVPDDFASTIVTRNTSSAYQTSTLGGLSGGEDDTGSKKRSISQTNNIYTSTGSGPCWSGACYGGFGTPQKCSPGTEQTSFIELCANCGNYECSGPSTAEQEFAAQNAWGCPASYPWMGISVRECSTCPKWDGVTPLTNLVGRKILLVSAANNNYLACNNARPYWGSYIINSPSSTPSSNAEFVISGATSLGQSFSAGWNVQLTLACSGNVVGPLIGVTTWACNTSNVIPGSSINIIPSQGSSVDLYSVYPADFDTPPEGVSEQGGDGLVVSEGGTNLHTLYVCPCGLQVQVFTATGSGPCWSGTSCGTSNYGTPALCPSGTSQTAYGSLCANCGNSLCTGTTWEEEDFRTQNSWGCSSSYPWLPISVRECSSCVATCTA